MLNGTSAGIQCKLLNNLLPMLHVRRQWKRIELEAGNTPKAARHCQGSGCSRSTMHWMQWIPVRDAVLQNVKMWIALIAPQSWNLSWPSLKPAIRCQSDPYAILWKDFSIGKIPKMKLNWQCLYRFFSQKNLRKKCVNQGVIFRPFGVILGHFGQKYSLPFP